MAKLSDYIRAMTELGAPIDKTVTEGEVFALLDRDERVARDKDEEKD